jgi:hypothetical protein
MSLLRIACGLSLVSLAVGMGGTTGCSASASGAWEVSSDGGGSGHPASSSSGGNETDDDAGSAGNGGLGGSGSGGGASSGSSGASGNGSSSGGGSSSSGASSGGSTVDAGGTQSSDGSVVSSPGDGGPAPRNSACTPTSKQTGTLVNTPHGRLDGTLVYVLPVGGSSACNGDDSHVHLQIAVSGLVYDVAVDVGSTGDDVGMYQTTLALPDGAWAEGWHGSDSLSYSTLGLHSTEFPTTSPSDIAASVESLVEDTAEISIFCTGYSEGDGCHDVHYENGNGDDGAIVLNPAAATPTILFFRFSDQTF